MNASQSQTGHIFDAPWLARSLDTYTWTLAFITTALAIIIALSQPPSSVQSILMVMLVALLGLPHGAYDLEVGKRIFRRRFGRHWWLGFGVAYALLAFAGLGLWLVAPLPALLLLLVGGAIHWGADDLEHPPVRPGPLLAIAASRGALPVALPLVFHPSESAEVFSALLADQSVSPQTVQAIAVISIFLAAPGVAWSIFKSAGKFQRCLAEVAVLTAWFAVAEPILAFTVYFCLWHSVRHSLRSAARNTNKTLSHALQTYTRAVIAPTLVTWILALPTATLLYQRNYADEAWVWRVVFIGLFALTIPHVLLEVLDSRRSRKA